ncbi:MAG: hypothetical protein IJY24_07520 [Clostridia bacterium]|nr:hypothetical protein [Clostridia bacterium]
MKEEFVDMPEWRDRWLAELDAVAPVASQELLDAPIATEDAEEAELSPLRAVDEGKKPEDGQRKGLWQRLFSLPRWVPALVSACAMLVLALAIVLAFVGGTPEEGVYIIEVNPSFALLTKDGVVTGIKSLGSDGDVLLSSGEMDSLVLGKEIDVAVVEYVELCVKYGYFDPEGDALRLSTEGEATGLGAKIEEGLIERGLFGAVVLRGLSEDSLAEVLGMTEMDFSKLSELPELFRERLALETEEGEIEEKYEQQVLKQDLMDYILSSLDRNMEKLRAHAALLDEIWRLEEQIISHGDNPTRILFVGEGYFSVIKGNYEYTPEFGELMSQMQTKLYTYKSEYGAEILDGASLALLHTAYSPTSTELLIGLIEYMSEELFIERGEELIGLLSATGVIGKELSDIFELPDSRESFLSKLEALSLSELNSRLSEYAEDYSPDRAAIDRDELESFKAALIEKYGSLENYFSAGK